MINFKAIRSLTIVLIFVSGLDLKAQKDTTTSILSFEEKLVEIAIKNNPDVEILLNNQNIAKYNMQKSRWNWMNQLQVQGNMNEFTLNESAAGSQAAFYPRYNISVTVPLGIFGTRANEVRIAKQEFESSDYELMKKQIEIRKQVLTLYGNYLLYQELITIQIQRTEDEYVFTRPWKINFQINRQPWLSLNLRVIVIIWSLKRNIC